MWQINTKHNKCPFIAENVWQLNVQHNAFPFIAGNLWQINVKHNVAKHVLLRIYFELEIWVAEAEQLFSCLLKDVNYKDPCKETIGVKIDFISNANG